MIIIRPARLVMPYATRSSLLSKVAPTKTVPKRTKTVTQRASTASPQKSISGFPKSITVRAGSTTASANGAGTSGDQEPKQEEWEKAKSVYDFTVKDMDGQDVPLSQFKGHPLIIINVASKCGYTKANYEEMNRLYNEYESQGLRILGFPCTQFKNQEYADIQKVRDFIEKKDVQWNVFAHVKVNGADACDLYKYLKANHGTKKGNGTPVGSAIKWNFVKFLIDKGGQPIARYASSIKNTLEPDLKELLG